MYSCNCGKEVREVVGMWKGGIAEREGIDQKKKKQSKKIKKQGTVSKV